MNERPKPDDESALPEDPAPGSDPGPTPRVPRPKTPANNLKVTPLDEDKNIEKGIEVNET
jgi:hypothetical protein